MKMLIKLIAFSALVSTCFAVTLPKSVLVRLCETARMARNLGFAKSQVSDALVADFNDIMGKVAFPFHLRQNVSVTADNYGLGQLLWAVEFDPELDADIAMSVTELLSGLMGLQSGKFPSLNSIKTPNLTGVVPEKLLNLFKPPQPTVAASNPTSTVDDSTSTSKLISGATREIFASLTANHCNNVDFPETVDTSNLVDVKKAVVRIVLSGLKHHKKTTESIENYLNAIDKKLFTR